MNSPAPANRDNLQPVTIITGGSHGIGAALADEFAAGGCDLLLLARKLDDLQQTAKKIRQAHGKKVFILALDLTTPDSTAMVESCLLENELYCQHLVNSAGFGLAGDFAKLPAFELSRMIDLNVRALSDLSRCFLPDMLVRGKGGILNVASLGGLLPGPYQAAYYASKSYVVSLTQALSWEVWGSGVHVCALLPGPVRTRFHDVMGAKSALYVSSGGGISAQKAARMGYSGFICGKTIIIPGILSFLGAIAIKIIPHDLLMPILAWFLKDRLKDSEHKV